MVLEKAGGKVVGVADVESPLGILENVDYEHPTLTTPDWSDSRG
jgi:hypothetical protein